MADDPISLRLERDRLDAENDRLARRVEELEADHDAGRPARRSVSRRLKGRTWLVWREHGRGPMVQCDTEENARQDAAKLAKLIGGTFYVLKAVDAFVHPTRIRLKPDTTARHAE